MHENNIILMKRFQQSQMLLMLLTSPSASVMVSFRTPQTQSHVTSPPVHSSLPVVITAAGDIFDVTSPSISIWIFYVPSSPTHADRAQISSVPCIYITVNYSILTHDYCPPPSSAVTYGFPCKVHIDRIYHDDASSCNGLLESQFNINSTSLGLRKRATWISMKLVF